ncbi:filamin-A-interacting protein 1-like [Selaginella moellendorffii]|uniref:filamin-A-interacting protein 1-like n=1 Tax=Selaginella moellendorffii TaxID=88036 RepID=UPI000D1CD548|nr:filamin-A-interacting protein 1-like [Selaginella moellendorffii]|eukprot:XP_024528818.1 filamin-A-interacting protein 1-like [Selaginella moellendorffii]
MKEMDENLAQFQQSHHQVVKENNLIIEELEIAKCFNVKRSADAADTRALEHILKSAKKALQGSAKGNDEKNDTAEAQLLVGDAVATVNELRNELQQTEPLKQVVDTANGHSNATIERLNHRIKDLESEQSRAFSYELRLKDALQTVSRLSDENDGLKQDLKSAASRYIAAEKQLFESLDSIKELKHVVSDLSNRLRRPQGGDLLEDRKSSSLLWKKITELEREVSTGQDKLQDAMSTIAQLKASKASLLRALNEAELMRQMYVTANDQLKQANQIIEQLTERLNEIESDLNSERDKTRNTLRDTVASIDRVNFRLKSSHALRLKNSTEMPPEASTDILSMITILNSRLCVLEQELSEQDLRRKVESPTRHSKQYPDCFMKIDGSLVRRAREEYKLLCSEIAEIESKKQYI